MVAEGCVEAFRPQDDAFHRAICAVCHLENVWGNLAESKAHTDRLRLLSIRDRSSEAIEDHRRILAGIAAGDPNRAGAAMRQHLDRIKNVLSDLMQTQPERFTTEDET